MTGKTGLAFKLEPAHPIKVVTLSLVRLIFGFIGFWNHCTDHTSTNEDRMASRWPAPFLAQAEWQLGGHGAGLPSLLGLEPRLFLSQAV